MKQLIARLIPIYQVLSIFLVVKPKMTFDGTVMPAFYKVDGFTRPGDAFTGKAAPADLPPLLSAQQVEDVVAYLMTLKDE